MDYEGVIRLFPTYNEKQLLQMRKDLAIRLDLDQLRICKRAYRKMKRDPYIAELQLLDLYAGCKPLFFHSVYPTKMHTNDAFLAQTYADMMAKRREMNPDRSSPLSFSALSEIANAYLSRAGLRFGNTGDALLPVNTALPDCPSADMRVLLKNSTAGLLLLNASSDRMMAGDRLILLTPLRAGDRSADFGAALTRFLRTPKAIKYLKSIFRVEDDGILGTVFRHIGGAKLDLSALGRVQEAVPVSFLIQACKGYLVLRVSAASENLILRHAQKAGLRHISLGIAVNDPFITVLGSSAGSFSLPHSLLRALSPARTASVMMKDESGTTPKHISTEISAFGPCRYLLQQEQKQTVLRYGKSVIAGGTATVTGGAFLQAVYTSLIPIILIAASGTEHTAAQLLTSLNVSATSETPEADALSAILGFYRVQAELAISARDIISEYERPVAGTELTVFAFGNGNPVASCLTNGENEVRLLQIPVDRDGLPCFADLRRILEILATLRRRNKLFSLHILQNETVTSGICAMATDRLTCRLSDCKIASGDPVPLGVLVETAPETGIGHAVGITEEKPSDSEPETDESTDRNAPAPNVVIVSQSGDSHAIELASILASHNAHVLHFTADGDAEALSDGIRNAKILIECGNPETEQKDDVRPALETFCKSGGVHLYVGRLNPTENTFPTGIPLQWLIRTMRNATDIKL